MVDELTKTGDMQRVRLVEVLDKLEVWWSMISFDRGGSYHAKKLDGVDEAAGFQ